MSRIVWRIVFLAVAALTLARAGSDPSHRATDCETPVPWPDGIIPYDLSKLTMEQRATVLGAMQRWMDTGARISFVPRTNQESWVSFTGKTDAGNNTTQTGYKAGKRTDINITAFWWRQGDWMPAHELGHVLGFHHEHTRWDRDEYVTIHYDKLKPGRRGDYDWIPKTNWLVSSTPYDYYSIMHYRVCWNSTNESLCKDGDGSSPCAVIDPVGTNYDRVIGQWTDNGISATDGERARRAYGIGQTLYVNPGRSGEGTGKLDDPYRYAAEAKRRSRPGARIIFLPAPSAHSEVSGQ